MINRRLFLKVGARGLASVTAACCGGQGVVGRLSHIAEIDYEQHTDDNDPSLDSSSLRGLVARVDRLLDVATRRYIPVPYETVTRTVLKRFLVYIEEDIVHGRHDRAVRVSEELHTMAHRALRELRKVLADPAMAMDVPLCQVSAQVICRDGGLYGQRRWIGNGKTDEGPIFLTGYGYFDQAEKDIENFPSYGTNIVQLVQDSEAVGRIFPNTETVNDEPIRHLHQLAEKASRGNVAVDVMFPSGPLPDWLYRKDQHLLDAYGEYIRFDIDSPEARNIFGVYLRLLTSHMRDEASFFSICLSNEPDYRESGKSVYSRKLWEEYLRQKHGTVERLNDLYGLNVADFSDVVNPTLGNEQLCSPQLFYDWCVFNQKRFIAWSKWQADIIHAVMPDARLHIKVAPSYSAPLSPVHVAWGIDPELTANAHAIVGCDGGTLYTTAGRYVEDDLVRYFLWYDLLYSISGKPVYNSENHLIHDNDPSYVPPGHIRSMIWQGAIHGVSATVLWYWERSYENEESGNAELRAQPTPPSWALESILTRPACVEAVGHTSLDLLRLAEEVRALQQAPQDIAILYSMPSFVYAARKYFSELYLLGLVGAGPGKIHQLFSDYYTAMARAYEALMFIGHRISFISEAQIQEGGLCKFRILIVPDATHVQQGTFEQVIRFVRTGGVLAVYGDNQWLSRDEYDRPLNREPLQSLERVLVIDGNLTGKPLTEEFRHVFQLAGIDSPVVVVDMAKGEPSFGVEWRWVEQGGRLLLNIINYTHSVKELHLEFKGRDGTLTNLFTGKRIAREMQLAPLNPALLELV